MNAHTMGAARAATLDPANWLSHFVELGGGYVVTDTRLQLVMQIEGRPIAALRELRTMMANLTGADTAQLRAHLNTGGRNV